MRPVSPVIPNANIPEVVVAENQDEYQNLPAIRLEGGVILCRWKLDEDERRRVAETGDIYLLQWTGGDFVTPMLLQVEPPEIQQPEPEPISQMMTAARRSEDMIKKAAAHNFEIFEDNCCNCSFPVIYTAATKETLAASPETSLVCTVCFAEMKKENPELQGVYLPNTQKEMAHVADLLRGVKESGSNC